MPGAQRGVAGTSTIAPIPALASQQSYFFTPHAHQLSQNRRRQAAPKRERSATKLSPTQHTLSRELPAPPTPCLHLSIPLHSHDHPPHDRNRRLLHRISPRRAHLPRLARRPQRRSTPPLLHARHPEAKPRRRRPRTRPQRHTQRRPRTNRRTKTQRTNPNARPASPHLARRAPSPATNHNFVRATQQ